MLVMLEGSSVLVYNRLGKLMYKSSTVLQYKKFDENNLIVITKDTVDTVTQVVQEGRQDILVSSDSKFVSALIKDNLVFIQRKLGIPILDIYNSSLVNVLRLYQGLGGEWIHFRVKLGVPYKVIVPTHLNKNILYGTHKGKVVCINLSTGQMKSEGVTPNGIPLTTVLKKFITEV